MKLDSFASILAICGLFGVASSGQSGNALLPLNSPGAVDTALFRGDRNDRVNALALRPDGKILVGARVDQRDRSGGTLERFNADGTLDQTFSSSGVSGGMWYLDAGKVVDLTAVSTLLLQNDGKLLVGGEFTSVGGVPRVAVARFHPDGALDLTFDASVMGETCEFGLCGTRVLAMAFQADGELLIGGEFTNVNGQAQSGLARLLSDGSSDPSFNEFKGVQGDLLGRKIQAIALEPDGRILIGGMFSAVNGKPARCLARLEITGEFATDFAPPDTIYSVAAIHVQLDGTILVGGTASGGKNGDTVSPGPPMLLRLQPDGKPDPTFRSPVFEGMPGSGRVSVRCLALDAKGRILVGGNFTTVSGQAVNHVTRLNQDGSLDSTYDVGTGVSDGSELPAFDSSINSALVQPDGRILIGGHFVSVNGHARTNIARLSGDPALPGAFIGPEPNVVRFQILTVAEKSYWLECTDSLSTPNWITVTGVEGKSALQWLVDPGANGTHRFYRLRIDRQRP